MKFKFINTAAAGLILCASFFVDIANAGLINSDYQTDGDLRLVLDESTGLEWLGLSNTKGMSYSRALLFYSEFELATNTQIVELYSAIFPNLLSSTFAFGGIDPTNDDSNSSLNWTSLFGSSGYSPEFSYGLYQDEDNRTRIAGARYGNGSYWIQGLEETTEWNSPASIIAGVFLVRKAQVPEPSTLVIFALGLIGLASRRFIKQ
jgi:hypothetical protein